MGIAQESIAVLVFGNFGDTPKTLGFSRFFGFNRSTRRLWRSSEGAGAARRLFDGADTTGEISFTSVRP